MNELRLGIRVGKLTINVESKEQWNQLLEQYREHTVAEMVRCVYTDFVTKLRQAS